MNKVKVGVLRGGPNEEYEVSLDSGANVLRHLPKDKYETHDILIDRDGLWHHQGLPIEPAKLRNRVDVVFNAMHGIYGEDGTVQKMLDDLMIPYNGSGAYSSGIAFNKHAAKKIVQGAGIQVPRHVTIGVDEASERHLLNIFRTFHHPSVVKPVAYGSTIGVTIADSFHDFLDGIAEAFNYGTRVMIEEYIPGQEATCGVIEDYRGQRYYRMMPIEVVPHSGTGFFDYDAKYAGKSDEICPSRFKRSIVREIEELTERVHRILGLKHYSRSDFRIHPRRGVFYLETNTLPGLTTGSLIPLSMRASGCEFPELLDHIVKLANTRK
jgi:D-alanine-D-alanine ligase